MYEFAIVALLALATLKIVDFLCANISPIESFRSLLTFVVAVGTVVWLDYSLFDNWAVDIRDQDLGVWVTGFVVSGFTVPWRAAFSWLTHDRATSDESLGAENAGFLRRAA
jgi:hypothetical protein